MEMAPYSALRLALNSDPQQANSLNPLSHSVQSSSSAIRSEDFLDVLGHDDDVRPNTSRSLSDRLMNLVGNNTFQDNFHEAPNLAALSDFRLDLNFNPNTILLKEDDNLPIDFDSLKKLEAYDTIRKRDAIRQAAARMRETPEQRSKRLERERIRVREKRRQETPEQREKRLAKARERVRMRRLMETPEERNKRLKTNCEATRKARKERKEVWDAFTVASSVTNDDLDEDLLLTPPPPMLNATQDLLNRLLETTLMQQPHSSMSTPTMNSANAYSRHHLIGVGDQNPEFEQKLEYTDEVFFSLIKKEFQMLTSSQRESAKIKMLEALLLVKHSDNNIIM